MTSYINIEFASTKIRAVDHFDDICKAVDYARINLLIRHNIRLKNPVIFAHRVWIPVTYPKDFKVGYNLRGITNYLLHKADSSFDYSKYFYGPRLLVYEKYDTIPYTEFNESENVAYRDMTIEEIEKELGYRIRIVSSKKGELINGST